ncbi:MULTISPECIES: type VI secretion system baseplate subunit TssF [unclassified Photorhabdus]|uniref:type VI secretion system baseplate subunit TssF n=1 Tax=unclassified Photorhabdus TaxID=2620880 RepID=UPI000DCE867D|nr:MULTISPECIES: type VI secretion system baseplate subunit TssF [unclassified Photorhabdus]RAW97771.1 type VI secretion system baseplate subunit TssF [Photorhabdus sp. S10-54]RAW97852.1 type VI secretion system baseplate subunit TssF [Photorhabdus sp. S9-53]RAX02090.1 type VI secretion system baseplate subunit TssF [Photorhabdus sp. S8-52]
MHEKLLEYYNRELAWLREMGDEFARYYPGIAGRLGMQGNDITDPYVERLLEGVAFLTSRIQLKMDAEFPRFSAQLLEALYPNYLAGLPSMAIVELQPDPTKGDLSKGFLVPRGSLMESQALKKKGISCRYRTAQDVTLQPLRLLQVELGGVSADVPLSALGGAEVQGTLRIQLSCFDNVSLGELQCDALMFYLSGGDIPALQLLELLMVHCQGVLCQIPGNAVQRLLLPPQSLRHEGFTAEQALLPVDLRNVDAYRLLQEYFAFPARFQFFSISGLQPLLAQAGKQQRLEIQILLDVRSPQLEKVVDVSHLALHCTPAINLFPRTAEPMTLNEQQHEYHVVVDNMRPLDYEVFSVTALRGIGTQHDSNERYIFHPLYRTQCSDALVNAGYFSIRRESRLLPQHVNRYGMRSDYLGSEVYLSLADEHHPPWRSDLKYLSAEVLCTNRDLPLLLQRQAQEGLVMQDSVPVAAVRLRKGPTEPRPALAESSACWQLINQLQFNYFSLQNCATEQGEAELRRLLRFHASQADAVIAQQINGIRSCRLQAQNRHMVGTPLFRRGISVALEIDDQTFSGRSPWLIGSVLAHLFSRLVTVNSFAETTLSSVQRGVIGFWSACDGVRTSL